MTALATYDGFFHYLPVDDTAMRWGWYVTGAGRGRIRPHQDYPPEGHPALYQFRWRQGRTLPEFQLVLITDGGGEFETKTGGRHTIDCGAVMLLTPGHWHRYRPESTTGWQERWISFNGELAHRLIELRHVDPHPALFRPENPQFVRQFDQILDQIHADPARHPHQLATLTMNLVAYVVEACDESARGRGSYPGHVDPLVNKTLQIIWTRSHYSLSAQHIARELSVSRRTLDRHFAAAQGWSILEEINRCRMQRAKRMLNETSLPIKSVAFLSGFPSAERMRVLFIENQGVSPTMYRAKHADA